MMEIRYIRKNLQSKKEELLSAKYQLAEKRLSDFIEYCKGNQIISKIISELPNIEIDFEKWEAELWGASDYGIPDDYSEAASYCWEIITKYRGRSVNIAQNFHVSSNKITDHVQEYFESFVPFIYDYIDNKLIELEEIISPLDMVSEVHALVNTGLSENYPEIQKRLNDVYKRLYISESNDEYVGIANSCRLIIIDFATLIYKSEYLPSNAEVPKNDDAKVKLKYTYRNSNSGISKSILEGREKFIDSIWQIVSSSVHRKNIHKEEIKEVVLLTYLLLSSFIKTMNKKLI